MKKHLTGNAVLNSEEIRYYLLKNAFVRGRRGFGIAVEFGDQQMVVRDLSVSAERVLDLLEQMRRGMVTPISVPDIIEDWLAEGSIPSDKRGNSGRNGCG